MADSSSRAPESSMPLQRAIPNTGVYQDKKNRAARRHGDAPCEETATTAAVNKEHLPVLRQCMLQQRKNRLAQRTPSPRSQVAARYPVNATCPPTNHSRREKSAQTKMSANRSVAKGQHAAHCPARTNSLTQAATSLTSAVFAATRHASFHVHSLRRPDLYPKRLPCRQRRTSHKTSGTSRAGRSGCARPAWPQPWLTAMRDLLESTKPPVVICANGVIGVDVVEAPGDAARD